MSDTSNNNNASLEEQIATLRAEIDRLNSQQSNPTTGSTTPDVNTTPSHGSGVVRAPGDSAKVIGAAGDPRGGTVLGMSDGTVKLVNVPQAAQNEPAQPFGSAPEGDYVQFFVDDNGNRYNWVSSDGSSVVSVDNPVQARP